MSRVVYDPFTRTGLIDFTFAAWGPWTDVPATTVTETLEG